MKSIRLIILCLTIPGASVILNGCCKVGCTKSDFTVRFIHFDMKDVDTVLLVGYEPNGQFNKVLDSSFNRSPYAIQVQLDTLTYYEPDLDLTHDYKIILPGTGLEYRVTDIQSKKISCSCSAGHFRRLAGYRLNGSQVTSEEYLDIKK